MPRSLPLVGLLILITAGSAVAQTLDGTISVRYRDRWGSDGWEDEDVFTYVRMNWWKDPAAREVGGAISLRWNEDLLTRSNEIDDGDSDLRVYTAYVDLNQAERFDFRLGRQILQEAEGFQTTGVLGVWKGRERGLRIGVFGGQPVSHYQSVSGEWTAGATFSMRPGARSRLRGSWIHVDEEETDNDVATVSYRYVSPNQWNGWATLRTLDFDVWNAFLGGHFVVRPLDLRLTTTYRRQEETNDSVSRYWSHLSQILGPSLPYQRFTVNANRAFADAVTLGAGWTHRDVLEDGENRSNQEYDRVHLDVFLHEKALAGFTANLNVSQWETDRDESTSIAGSVSRRFGPHLEIDLGSYYSKYDVRTFFDDPEIAPVERYDVRTWYVEADWKVREKYRLQLEFERGTEARSDDPFYQLELRFGLDIGFLARGFSE